MLAAAQKAQLKKQGLNAISGNSKSIERAMEQIAQHGRAGESKGPEVAMALGSIATGEKFFGLSKLYQIVADVLHKRMSISPAVNASMARMLTSNDPAVRAAAMARLHPEGAALPKRGSTLPALTASTAASAQSGP